MKGVHVGQCGCSFEGKAWAAGQVKATGMGRGLNPEGLAALLKILFSSQGWAPGSSSMVLNREAGGEDGQENFNFYFLKKLCCSLVKQLSKLTY